MNLLDSLGLISVFSVTAAVVSLFVPSSWFIPMLLIAALSGIVATVGLTYFGFKKQTVLMPIWMLGMVLLFPFMNLVFYLVKKLE